MKTMLELLDEEIRKNEADVALGLESFMATKARACNERTAADPALHKLVARFAERTSLALFSRVIPPTAALLEFSLTDLVITWEKVNDKFSEQFKQSEKSSEVSEEKVLKKILGFTYEQLEVIIDFWESNKNNENITKSS